MKRFIRNAAAASLLLGMALPVSAMAADQDLDQKVDSLAKEVEGIKRDAAQAKRKSLGQWLEIGGDYRFRMDGLWGQTAAYTDVTKTFANTEQTLQSNFFNSVPVPPGFSSWQSQIGGLMNFASGMKQVSSFSGAQTFLANNQQMVQGIGNFAVQVPAYKPENDTLNSNRFGINLHAKPIQDVTVKEVAPLV